MEYNILDFTGHIHVPYSALYLYGSRVYGTDSEDSDYDFILVLPKGAIKYTSLHSVVDYHYQIYTHDEWLYKIHNHDICALECIFSPDFNYENNYNYLQHFTLDLHKLRESISTIANNSWVKGKKKLIISGDYDKKAALKSIFHSIRILRFGTQVARTGKISDFSESNWLWEELSKLGEQYDADILWEKINSRYKDIFSKVSSEFKSVAPKDLVSRDKVRSLRKILEAHNCYSQELADEIKALYE